MRLGLLSQTIARRIIYNKGPNNMSDSEHHKAKEVFSSLPLLAWTWSEKPPDPRWQVCDMYIKPGDNCITRPGS